MILHRVALGALALASISTTASAAVVLHTSSFITTPVATNDFEAIAPALYPFNTAYAQGGVTVTYVTMLDGDGPILTFPLLGTTGNRSWVNIDNHGYTSIKLTDGSSFDQAQFAAQSGRSEGLLHYQLMHQGNVVSTGVTGGIPFATDPVGIAGFSGELFDEIRVKSSDSGFAQFEPGAGDSLYLDDIMIGRTLTAAVPEPATWAMLVMGFGTVGTLLRRPRRKRAVVFA